MPQHLTSGRMRQLGRANQLLFLFYFSTLGSIDPEGLDHPIMSYFPDTVSVCYYFLNPR